MSLQILNNRLTTLARKGAEDTGLIPFATKANNKGLSDSRFFGRPLRFVHLQRDAIQLSLFPHT